MKYLAVSLVLLAVLIPEALSIKCYQCTNIDGNCKDNNKDCPDKVPILGYKIDRCLKMKVGDAVTKGCSSKTLCDALKFCDGKKDCEALCCEGDGCNTSSSLAPAFLLTSVAVLVTKFFM